MSEIIPHLRAKGPGRKVREYGQPATGRDFKGGLQPVIIEFEDASTGLGTCLGCRDAPCMMLAAEGLALPEALGEFPGDPVREVCPTGAITWNDSGEVAVVNDDTCIGCGLCVARCPYGAISLTSEGVAVVESGDPDGLTVATPDASSAIGHVRPTSVGRIGPVPFPALQRMPEAIASLNSQVSNRFVRNLLLECGIKCRTRRQGDTNVRMDGVLATTDGRLGVLEIELGNEVLESPRALLEDVAVLHGRYGVEVGSIDPVSVIVGLPNVRSEYYQVVSDIEKVLNLRCRTVTVGAMLAVLWNFERIDGFTGDLFLTSPDITDLLSPIRHHLSDSISVWPPYEGAYRPAK